MNSFEFYSPTKVYFGKNGAEKTGQAIKEFGGKRVLLHYGSDRVLNNGLMDTVTKSLDAVGIPYVMFGGVVPNPRVSLVREGAELVRKEQIDFIFAVGGGSVIDSAKGIALAACADCDIWDIWDNTVAPTKALPTANILTIAAAGSETSGSAVLTNEENWLKVGFGAPVMRPVFTIMDPELLYTLPPYQTAAGVVDIIVHSFERYFSQGGTNELTDRLAEEVLRVTMRYGSMCMEQPEDYEARSEVMWAGSVSHNDLTGLGREGDWTVHRLEHELSGKYDVTHGAGLAAVWGSWARYVYKADIMRFARYGVKVLDLPMDFENPENTALEAIRRTEDYFASIDMPINITDLCGHEVSDADIEDMADKASHYGTRVLGSFMGLDRLSMVEIYKNAR